jgi:hypothetical protein
MEAAGTRYELVVGTLLSKASLATLRVRARPTAVPRSTVYRLRVPADRDLAEVLHRLTECNVQVLQIRRCPEPRSREGVTPPAREEEPPQETGDPADATGGVVVPFRARPGRNRRAPTPRGGSSAG